MRIVGRYLVLLLFSQQTQVIANVNMAAFIEPSVLQAKSLTEYLLTLSAAKLQKLYNHPANCLAIFRDLPYLARIYVLRILFVDQIIPESSVDTWSKLPK